MYLFIHEEIHETLIRQFRCLNHVPREALRPSATSFTYAQVTEG